MIPLCSNVNYSMNRRDFLGRTTLGIGGAALMSLLNADAARAAVPAVANPFKGVMDAPHFAPRAKRVIYLFQSGAPSQLDLFDYKPELAKQRGEDLPDSVRKGQRLTGMTAAQARFPIAPTMFQFAQHGQSGVWLSELLPHVAGVADHLCFVKTIASV